MEVKPIVREKLYLTILEQLENKIISGEIAVGEYLPSESELAASFGVGKRPVREALQILDAKGLVRRAHGERTRVIRQDVGVFIDSLSKNIKHLLSETKQHFYELMQVRRIIEVQVAGLVAAKIGDEELRTLEEALEMMKRAADDNDIALLADADALFHRSLVNALGNEILSVFYDQLYGLVHDEIAVTVKVHKKDSQRAYDEHLEIYNMLRDHNSVGVQELVARQIEGSTGFLHEVIGDAE